jgi:hypothetical protein
MARITRLFAASLLSLAAPAWAVSDAARPPVEEQIAAACDGRPGSIDPAGVVERDLDGDGRTDLVLSHEHIDCQGQPARSIFCGTQVCSLLFYVRRGDLLQPAGEILGSLGPISDNEVPVITTYGHGGGQALWRWNGQRFAPVN